MLEELLIIFFINYLGIIIVNIFQLPIPAPIVGMLILFLLLYFKKLNFNKIEKISTFLLSNMTLFFLPPAVKLLENIHLLENGFLKILILVISTTIFTIIITAKTVQFLIEKGEKNGTNNR